MNVPRALYYNFRLAPEAVWLIISAIGGSALLAIYTTDFTTITDWRAWAWGFFLTLIFRTIPGAILAVVSGGGFQKPGEPALNEPPSDVPAEGVITDGNHEG